MRSILVLVILGLAFQNSLAIPHTREEPEGLFDDLEPSSAFDPVLSKLQAMETQEAEQTIVISKLLSSYDNIYEKLTKIENQIAGLQKNVQPAEIVEDWLKPTEGPVSEDIDAHLLENYEKIGSKYYHIEDDESLDWHDALAKCKSINGNLLSLKSEAEWQTITSRLNRQKSYWVDINDRETEGEFVSETSGQLAPFFKWDIAEPNNMAFSFNDENCVELRSGYNHYMNDISCYNTNNYVCEANLNN